MPLDVQKYSALCQRLVDGVLRTLADLHRMASEDMGLKRGRLPGAACLGRPAASPEKHSNIIATPPRKLTWPPVSIDVQAIAEVL